MHRLDGPRLKIRRAESEIERLCRLEESFRSEAKYQIVRAEMNPKTGKYVYRARVIHEPPLDEWGVWVGEIVHNLRSALDGLVFQLARLNKSPAQARDTQFPIFRHRYTKRLRGGQVMGFEGHQGAKRPARGSGRYMIRRLGPEHQARIEWLQPYRRNGGQTPWGRPLNGRWNLLYRLKELNDADKHRLIQLVGAKVGGGPVYGGWGDRIEDEVIFGHTQILKDGTKVMQAGSRVQVYADIIPLIAFWKGCKAVKNVGVCTTLRLIAKNVSEIVEGFAPEFA